MLRHTTFALTMLATSLFLAPACDSSDSEGADSDMSTTNGSGETEAPQECGTEWADKDDTTPSILDEWGAACMQDSDCSAILGEGGVCINNILGVYDLPGGFCTKLCNLPDTMTTFVHNDPVCDPEGGVTCVGAKGLFEACIVSCETSDQCGREGYGCTTMPTIASEGDPSFCLMSTTDCCTTDSGECV